MMVIEHLLIVSFILNIAKCNEGRTYLIEQSNVRGIKFGEEIHWTLDLDGSYIVESVRINVTFVDSQMFWMKVNDKKVSKICNQSFTEENGWMVIKCNESLIVGRQLIITTSFTNSDLINNNLLIDICSMTAHPLIDANITLDSSFDSENNNIVYYENVSCKLISIWPNYAWWILIDIKEEVFVESFTFSGKEFEVINVDIGKSVKAQVIYQKTVNFNEDDTFCQLGSYFTCNKIGTYILIKGTTVGPARYLICQAHIFGFKAHGVSKMMEKRHGRCDFKILEKTYKKENKVTSNKFWMISLVVLLILLCLVTWGILRMKYQGSGQQRHVCYLMRDVQTNKSQMYVKKKNLNLEMDDELWMFPPENMKTSNVGKNPRHLQKNRFRNILPFDDNLVTLEDDDGNSYINASFIRSSDGDPMAYIATQAPMANTVNEFWFLVWQYKVNVIAMLTQLTENFSPKCEQYWPDVDEREASFGKISVTVVHEWQYADYVLRHFILKLIHSIEAERVVIHSQFLSWSDFNVPCHSFPLLDFRNKVNYFHEKSKGPLLVHCSAGIGRTGSYIAIDYLIKQAELEGKVSVYKCVKDLRLQRMNMVQNKYQCNFIERAVAEAGIISQTRMTCIDFVKKFHGIIRLSSIQTCQNMCRIIAEEHKQLYKTLKNINKINLRKCSKNNKTLKNTNNLNQENEESVNYDWYVEEGSIVSIQCYNMSNAHILANIPSCDMRSNFWHMLWDQDIEQIFFLEDDKKQPPYWPESKLFELELPTLAISQTMEDKNNIFCTVRKFIMSNEDRGKHAQSQSKEVTQYHVTKRLWPEYSQIPANKHQFHKILKQLLNSGKRIVLQCLNGSSRSGLAAAAMLMIDMILLDETVDPFLACRYVLASRPEAICSQEQFNFLYELALEFLEDSEKCYHRQK